MISRLSLSVFRSIFVHRGLRLFLRPSADGRCARAEPISMWNRTHLDAEQDRSQRAGGDAILKSGNEPRGSEVRGDCLCSHQAFLRVFCLRHRSSAERAACVQEAISPVLSGSMLSSSSELISMALAGDVLDDVQ